MTRQSVLVFAVLSMSVSALAGQEQLEQSCDADISEVLYRSELVLLARLKQLHRTPATLKYLVSVSKVFKDVNNRLRPKQKLTVVQTPTLCNNSSAQDVQENKKYIFSLSTVNKVLTLQASPQNASKKLKRILKNLLCEGCGHGPIIKPPRRSVGVEMYRYRGGTV